MADKKLTAEDEWHVLADLADTHPERGIKLPPLGQRKQYERSAADNINDMVYVVASAVIVCLLVWYFL